MGWAEVSAYPFGVADAKGISAVIGGPGVAGRRLTLPPPLHN
jgi:hypothetical protein